MLPRGFRQWHGVLAPVRARLLAGATLYFVSAGVVFAASPIPWQHLEDPLVRAAQFDVLQGEPFAAIIRLEADLLQGRIKHRPTQAQLVLAGMYLDYGMHHKAAEIFRTLASSDQPQSVRGLAWLHLAQIQHQRGQTEEALASLSRIGGALPGDAQQERLLLAGTVLMQEQRFAEAEASLRQLGQESLLQQLGEKSVWPTYGRFNLGVALFRQGKEEGQQLLHELGEMSADPEEGRALRDKANLTLAYQYLAKQQPAKAQQYFIKTRLQGPMSNRALLGLGRVYSAKEQHKKSLVPWLKLIKSDASDPAVQDGLLAVPFAFGKLEAFKQALQYYQQALETFKVEMAQLRLAETAINEGALMEKLTRMTGNPSAAKAELLQQLPDMPGSRYLWQMFATHEFQEVLKNHARLRLSQKRLEQWSAQLAGAGDLAPAHRRSLEKKALDLQGKLAAILNRTQAYLNGMAQQTLQQRKQRLLGYAGEARFSMAQIYDYAAKRWGTGQ